MTIFGSPARRGGGLRTLTAQEQTREWVVALPSAAVTQVTGERLADQISVADRSNQAGGFNVSSYDH
jgi:hypothetical protein